MRLFQHLWIRIGVPIAVLTLLAAGGLAILGHTILALLVAVLGVGTIYATRLSLAPLEDVTRVVEGIADGDLQHQSIQTDRTDEIGRLSQSTNQMIDQLSQLSATAERLARGEIDVVDAEQAVLDSGDLADADLETGDVGDLEESFVRMTNQMRRLTIQARIIARDDLQNPLLDEEVPGELGDSFALMVDNLRTIAERAEEIADGDLTSYVDGDGDLTTAFNQMVTGLNDLVQQIVETAIHISSASEEILVVLQDQELAASHQASGVEETQRTMETLLASARKIADNSQTVYKSAEKTQANNRKIAERIGELKSHTNRITEILEVIKSIADRSDLLALNASLEGMRAGEAGKGFTLVAEEMRRLAENIKDSIGDIKELVSDIRESSMATVMATEEGSRLSEETTETALQISLITQQQKSGTEQVTQSMDELSQLINQGVAGTRQVTTAARDLADTAENLRTLVDEFEVDDPPDDEEIRQRARQQHDYYDTSPVEVDESDLSASEDETPEGFADFSGDPDDSFAPPAETDDDFEPADFEADGDFADTSPADDLGGDLDADLADELDPSATLTQSRKFAERARNTQANPAVSDEDLEQLGEQLGEATDDADPMDDDTGLEDVSEADQSELDTPTVKFSSQQADEELMDDLASLGDDDTSGSPDRSEEFAAIARDIEETDDASETDGDTNGDGEPSEEK